MVIYDQYLLCKLCGHKKVFDNWKVIFYTNTRLLDYCIELLLKTERELPDEVW